MEGATTMDKKQLVKLISYFAMGDGGLYVQDGGNAKFIMNMKAEHEDYCSWVASVISEVTGVSIKERKDYNTDGCIRQPQLRVESNRHPFLTTIRDRIYTEKYRGIDPHALKLLDWEALAILYMCDGSFVKDFRPEIGMKNPSYNVTLNLKRLSYGDLFILKKALKETLGLEWNINKQGKYNYLRLRTKDVDNFMNGIRSYLLPSFQYKLLSERLTPEMGGDIV